MAELSSRYSGGKETTGIILVILFSLIFAIKGGIQFGLCSYFLKRTDLTRSFRQILLLVSCASVFALTDWLFSILFASAPWFFDFLGYTQMKDLYFIQLAEVGGVWVLTFTLVLINILVAIAWHKRQIRLLIPGLSLLFLLHIYGYFRIGSIDKQAGQKVKISMICDNTPPEIRWNKVQLNGYVNQLLKMNEQAVAGRPDLIIWNEGSVPWTYCKDDDLLKVVLKQNIDTDLYQLMSYFTVCTEDSSCTYNSACLFKWNGTVEGRYDKNILLGGLEKPFWNISGMEIPFINHNGKGQTIDGKSVELMDAKGIGKFGVILCNESLSDNITSQLGRKGVSFIVLMANDNWFSGTQLIPLHYYLTRLRAIEIRKDIAINANMGHSGIITACGYARDDVLSDEQKILNSEIDCRTGSSSYYFRKTIFLFSISLFIFLNLIYFKTKAYV
jgi:apolipoprotein N-acyltransferase